MSERQILKSLVGVLEERFPEAEVLKPGCRQKIRAIRRENGIYDLINEKYRLKIEETENVKEDI
ncbi:hypothetical protein DRO69_06560 [Candidatus Bathyarchaeota archaeon]|nr:MAG: hypothetical protein DRO69_06560 [Candidatus Bathyarchaeota archaeon]